MKAAKAWPGLLLILTASAAAGPMDAPRQGLLGARAAGMGGVESAGAPDLEALLYDPADLPDSGVHLATFGALDPAQRGQAGIGLTAPLDDSLRWGFFAGGLQDQGLDPFQTQTLALAAATDLVPGLSLGLRGQWRQLEATALDQPVRGASLDLGLRDRGLVIPGLPGRWAVGLSADHILGLGEDAAWDEALPLVGRVSASYRPWPNFCLALQEDWSSATQLEQSASRTWHQGLEWDITQVVALRAGYSDDGQAALFSTGASFDLPQPGAGLDYALMGGPNQAGLSQRLSLRWAWAYRPRAEMGVGVAQLLRDPDSGIVRSALLEVTLSPQLRQHPWHVELKDGQGEVWRTLTPQDPQDTRLVWDGRDDQGRLRPVPRDLRAELIAQDDAQQPLRALAALDLDRSEQQAELARADQGQAAPSFKPVFGDANGKELSYVVIGLPATRAQSWSLNVEDSHERNLRTLAGRGDLPHSLVWDGRDAQGHKVDDALSAQVRLQVTDPQGRLAEQQLPLFDQKTFVFAQREARQRPELRLASLGLPLILARPSLTWMDSFLPALSSRAQERLSSGADQEQGSTGSRPLRYRREVGRALELDLFDRGAASILPQRMDLLAPIRRHLKGIEPGHEVLWVTGLARKDEAHPGPLARRRSEALARVLRAQGEDIQIALEAPGAAGDFKGVRLEFRPGGLSARYHPLEPPSDLGQDLPVPPSGGWQAWIPEGSRFKGPLAWCPAAARLVFFRDGWVWVTDQQGSSLRTLWFEPGLAADGRLAWSADGSHLWIRADRWRGWLSLQMQP